MIIFERQLKKELHIDFRNKVREDSQLILKEDEAGNIKLDINGQDATLPSYSAEDAGKSLKVNADGSATEWAATEVCVNGIRLNLDNEFKMSADLLKDSAVVASSNVIDLPIESLVISGRYDAAQKAIILTLQSGQEIVVPVGDLVAGLVSEATFKAHAENGDIHVTADKKAYWDAKVEAAVVDALAEKVDAKADKTELAGKLDVMPGDEHTAGNAYNLPYFFKIEALADKIVVSAETVSLDGKKTYGVYSMDVPCANAEKAGLMSASDKAIVDATEGNFRAVEEELNAHEQAIAGKADASALANKLEAYKVTVNGKAGQYVGEANVPVYFDADVDADKITVNSYAVALNTTKEQVAQKSSLDIPAATEASAGLLSAADKAKINAAITEHQDISGKLNILPKVDDPTDPGFGWEYHIPYRFDFAADESKIDITLHTLTLDNKFTKMKFNSAIPSATATTAGLMSAADKVALGNKADVPANCPAWLNPTGQTPTPWFMASLDVESEGTGPDADGNLRVNVGAYNFNMKQYYKWEKNLPFAVTSTKAGLMSASDKVALDAIKNRIPECPTTEEGRYVLEAEVVDGVVTYKWVAKA